MREEPLGVLPLLLEVLEPERLLLEEPLFELLEVLLDELLPERPLLLELLLLGRALVPLLLELLELGRLTLLESLRPLELLLEELLPVRLLVLEPLLLGRALLDELLELGRLTLLLLELLDELLELGRLVVAGRFRLSTAPLLLELLLVPGVLKLLALLPCGWTVAPLLGSVLWL